MKTRQIILFCILTIFFSCDRNTEGNCVDYIGLNCDYVDWFESQLSAEALEVISEENQWKIVKGKKDHDSVFVVDRNGRLLFESKFNELQNIHGYANFYSASSECVITEYYLNGEKFGITTKSYHDGRSFLYTFPGEYNDVWFSFLKCDENISLVLHGDGNSLIIFSDLTAHPVQGAQFVLNIYVPSPPETKRMLEFSLDSSFTNPRKIKPYPDIRELFTHELVSEGSGPVKVYYRYTILSDSNAILYRVVVPFEINVTPSR